MLEYMGNFRTFCNIQEISQTTRILREHFGTFQNILEHSQKRWKIVVPLKMSRKFLFYKILENRTILKISGTFQNILVHLGNLWQIHSGTFGKFFKNLEISGILWEHFEVLQNIRKYSGTLTKLLEHCGTCENFIKRFRNLWNGTF